MKKSPFFKGAFFYDYYYLKIVGNYNYIKTGISLKQYIKQKHIPVEHELSHSIITLRVPPRNVDLVEDTYRSGKIRISFVDNDGANYRYWSITDLGFYRYMINHIDELNDINNFIHNQELVFIRIGLTRK